MYKDFIDSYIDLIWGVDEDIDVQNIRVNYDDCKLDVDCKITAVNALLSNDYRADVFKHVALSANLSEKIYKKFMYFVKRGYRRINIVSDFSASLKGMIPFVVNDKITLYSRNMVHDIRPFRYHNDVLVDLYGIEMNSDKGQIYHKIAAMMSKELMVNHNDVLLYSYSADQMMPNSTIIYNQQEDGNPSEIEYFDSIMTLIDPSSATSLDELSDVLRKAITEFVEHELKLICEIISLITDKSSEFYVYNIIDTAGIDLIGSIAFDIQADESNKNMYDKIYVGSEDSIYSQGWIPFEFIRGATNLALIRRKWLNKDFSAPPFILLIVEEAEHILQNLLAESEYSSKISYPESLDLTAKYMVRRAILNYIMETSEIMISLANNCVDGKYLVLNMGYNSYDTDELSLYDHRHQTWFDSSWLELPIYKDKLCDMIKNKILNLVAENQNTPLSRIVIKIAVTVAISSADDMDFDEAFQDIQQKYFKDFTVTPKIYNRYELAHFTTIPLIHTRDILFKNPISETVLPQMLYVAYSCDEVPYSTVANYFDSGIRNLSNDAVGENMHKYLITRNVDEIATYMDEVFDNINKNLKLATNNEDIYSPNPNNSDDYKIELSMYHELNMYSLVDNISDIIALSKVRRGEDNQ